MMKIKVEYNDAAIGEFDGNYDVHDNCVEIVWLIDDVFEHVIIPLTSIIEFRSQYMEKT